MICPGWAQSEEQDIEAAPGQYVSDYITLDTEMAELSLMFDIGNTALNLNPKTSPAILHGFIEVNETQPWKLTVSSTNDGYMAEYDRAASGYIYEGLWLRAPMSLSAEGGNTLNLSSLASSNILISGTQSTGDTPIAITFTQPVSWLDEILPVNRIYRITVTITQEPQ